MTGKNNKCRGFRYDSGDADLWRRDPGNQLFLYLAPDGGLRCSIPEGGFLFSSAFIVSVYHCVCIMITQINRHHTGVVSRESSVDTAMHFAAKDASHPYWEANIAVVPPMGMAASTTETPDTNALT